MKQQTSRLSYLPGMALGLVLTLGLISSAQAQLLVYDGFDGYSVGSMNGQTINANTIGMNTSGTYSGGGPDANAINYQTSGLTFGSGSTTLLTSGGSIYADGTGAGVLTGNMSLSSSYSGTLYQSFLVDFNDSTVSTARAELRREGGFFYSKGTPVITYNGGSLSFGTAVTNTSTFIVISEFTNVGSALSVGDPGVATQWVMTTDQFNNFKAGGLTAAELNSATVGSGATNVWSRATNQATSGTYDFPSSGGLQLVMLESGGNPIMDEMRWGTSLDFVTPVSPVPEPGSAALIGAAVLMGGFLRRRARNARR